MNIKEKRLSKNLLKLGAAALASVITLSAVPASSANAASMDKIHETMISRLQASADTMLKSHLYSKYAENEMKAIIKEYSSEIKTATTEKRANYIRSLGYAALKEVEYVKDVAIDEAHFPDRAFRSSVSAAFDTNNDGVLQKSEAENALELEAQALNIYDLSGVGYLPFLKTLNVSGNNLSVLDLSKNAVLVNVDCSVNNISEFNIRGLEKLKNLNCAANSISSISLKEAKKLVSLNCDANPIEKLNLSKNTKLSSLSCCLCNLTELDLSKNTALTSVICHNNSIASIDVTKCPELTELLASNNKLTKLVVTQNKKLEVLDCSKNALSSLHLRNNKKLLYLDCSSNKIPQLNVTMLKKLKSFMHDKKVKFVK